MINARGQVGDAGWPETNEAHLEQTSGELAEEVGLVKSKAARVT
jgi:hypothetical protein